VIEVVADVIQSYGDRILILKDLTGLEMPAAENAPTEIPATPSRIL
jgi:hypothetical protein